MSIYYKSILCISFLRVPIRRTGCEGASPVFYGAQGARKSTAIEWMSPSKDFFIKISFSDKDDDIRRKLKGVLVAEIDELRGLNSKDADHIKSFIHDVAFSHKELMFESLYNKKFLF